MFYLMCYQCSRSASLNSFVYDSFVIKAIPKIFYIALTNTCVNKGFLKKTCSFRSVIRSKSMGTQVSMNEEVPDLLLEREVGSVISSTETEVFKYELATNLAI